MKSLLVLAGGFGTRLRSVVSEVPKPLAPVANKAFIEYLIRHWVDQGVKDFIFLLHYESAQIKKVLNVIFSDPKFMSISFKTLTEDIPLGTGGSILNAIDKLKITDSFLVSNADTWLGSGIQALSNSSASSLVAIKVPNCQRYGSLEINGKIITSFKEKSYSSGLGYISSGLYHLRPNIFDGFEPGSNFSLEEDIFPALVKNKNLDVIKLNMNFIDIGIPDDYFKFCNWIESGKNNEL